MSYVVASPFVLHGTIPTNEFSCVGTVPTKRFMLLCSVTPTSLNLFVLSVVHVVGISGGRNTYLSLGVDLCVCSSHTPTVLEWSNDPWTRQT